MARQFQEQDVLSEFLIGRFHTHDMRNITTLFIDDDGVDVVSLVAFVFYRCYRLYEHPSVCACVCLFQRFVRLFFSLFSVSIEWKLVVVPQS